jgi:GNAT superfamily N-acetyltransferase
VDSVRAQAARFAALDPLLPPASGLPPGERLTARLPDGREVSGALYRAVHDESSVESLWSPRETWELSPVLGDTGGPGLHALLSAWRDRVRRDPPGEDSACVLTWPSRDAEAIRVLLDHGFVPENAIAVRPDRHDSPPGPARVTVRRATPADLEELVQLELAELRYAALVGMSGSRSGAADMLAPGLRGILADGLVWLAESDGVATGMAACRPPSPVAGTTLANRLPEGRWGFVGTLSVAGPARGQGVGTALMAAAHRALNAAPARGTFLFYNPINPLSSRFWHRQGYRPLWTIWDIRPAAALR